jgi:hypothetical protein
MGKTYDKTTLSEYITYGITAPIIVATDYVKKS